MALHDYRPNAVAVTLLEGKFVVVNLIVWTEDQWKFPQGGREGDESPEEAVRRELSEELGVTDIEIVGVSERANRYDWPAETRALYNDRYAGQEQRFVVVRILDGASIEPGPEVRTYRLIDRETVARWSSENHEYFRDYNGLIPSILDEFGL